MTDFVTNPSSPVLVFEGFSPNGKMGQVLTGGNFYYDGQERMTDLNGDGIPDFVMVATTGYSLVLQDAGSFGEAYLVYGFGTRQAQQRVPVSALAHRAPPAPQWPGAIFSGVRYDTARRGPPWGLRP